ncbi:hypothetical protein WOLCODRAFT_159383 [Wolfiporia cocos MD-104 SS10]|uniref:Uncharacterized protein n=1 Tax=Wolfiporia cocos (strain MD-104) TaxID=742152 RepID=A0A2H3JPC5_WOLCO|nr:hypothetical protein WOLCODRAFT_159383 [Wolfiporia cocos MD-104 SS10]
MTSQAASTSQVGEHEITNPVNNPFGTESPIEINVHLPPIEEGSDEEEADGGEEREQPQGPLLFPREFGAFASPAFEYEAPPALTVNQAEERILGGVDATVSVRYHPEVLANVINDSIRASTHIAHAYAKQVKGWGEYDMKRLTRKFDQLRQYVIVQDARIRDLEDRLTRRVERAERLMSTTPAPAPATAAIAPIRKEKVPPPPEFSGTVSQEIPLYLAYNPVCRDLAPLVD